MTGCLSEHSPLPPLPFEAAVCIAVTGRTVGGHTEQKQRDKMELPEKGDGEQREANGSERSARLPLKFSRRGHHQVAPFQPNPFQGILSWAGNGLTLSDGGRLKGEIKSMGLS